MIGHRTAAASRPPVATLSLDYWRFLLFGRAIPIVLFSFLGYRQWENVWNTIHALPQQPGLGDIARGPLPGFLYLMFCALPVAIYVVRPRPQARDGRIVARAAAFVGTLMLLGVNFFQNPVPITLPGWLADLSSPLLLGAYVLAVWGLSCLRKSFSIIPEARSVVSNGPYRLIRHPLYAAEIAAALAAVIARPALWPLLAFPVFVAVQLVRGIFEERLLGDTFPEYREYASRTWRIIPGVL